VRGVVQCGSGRASSIDWLTTWVGDSADRYLHLDEARQRIDAAREQASAATPPVAAIEHNTA